MNIKFFYKNIITIILVFVSANVFAGKPPKEEIPELHSALQKLQYLKWVKEQVPYLLQDAAKYDFNLFGLLDDYQRLIKDLETLGDQYNGASNNRDYLKLKVKPSPNQSVQSTVRINPKAIEAWKNELDSTLTWLENAHPHFKTESIDQAIVQELLKAQKELTEGEKVQSIFNFLISRLKKSIQSGENSLEGVFTSKDKIQSPADWENKLKQLEDALPEIIENFDPKKIGLNLKEPVHKKELFAKVRMDLPNLLHKDELEQRKIALTTLAISLMTGNPPSLSESLSDPHEAIKKLSASDLTTLNDKKDVLLPKIEALTQKVFAEQKISNPKQRKSYSKQLLESVHSRLEAYFKDQETIKLQPQKNETLYLLEMPPGIGIFRGAAGQDCSSQRSFPYPCHPGERVFFIYKKNDKKEELKGYVSARLVDLEQTPGEPKQRSLYVHTIAGPNVTGPDTEKILNMLEKSKDLLEVKHIVLPTNDNIHGLINFVPIRNVYDQLTKEKKIIPITNVNPEISERIERFESHHNTGDYDWRENNRHGVVYIPPNSEPEDHLTVKSKTVAFLKKGVKDITDQSITPNDIIEFCLDLLNSEREAQIPEVRSIAHISRESWIRFVKLYRNDTHETVQDFKKKLQIVLSEMGARASEELFKTRPDLLSYGLINSSDAFSKAQIGHTLKNMKILIEKGVKLKEINRLILSHIDIVLAEGSPVKNVCDKLSKKNADSLEDLEDILKNTHRITSLELLNRLNDPSEEDAGAAAEAIIGIDDSTASVQKKLAEVFFDVSGGTIVFNDAKKKVFQHYSRLHPGFETHLQNVFQNLTENQWQVISKAIVEDHFSATIKDIEQKWIIQDKDKKDLEKHLKLWFSGDIILSPKELVQSILKAQSNDFIYDFFYKLFYTLSFDYQKIDFLNSLMGRQQDLKIAHLLLTALNSLGFTGVKTVAHAIIQSLGGIRNWKKPECLIYMRELLDAYGRVQSNEEFLEAKNQAEWLARLGHDHHNVVIDFNENYFPVYQSWTEAIQGALKKLLAAEHKETDDEMLKFLKHAFESPYSEIRELVANDLSERKDPESLDLIYAWMDADKNPRQREVAAIILNRKDDSHAERLLKRCLRDKTFQSCSVDQTVLAVKKLKGKTDQISIEAVLEALNSQDWNIVKAAAETLDHSLNMNTDWDKNKWIPPMKKILDAYGRVQSNVQFLEAKNQAEWAARLGYDHRNFVIDFNKKYFPVYQSWTKAIQVALKKFLAVEHIKKDHEMLKFLEHAFESPYSEIRELVANDLSERKGPENLNLIPTWMNWGKKSKQREKAYQILDRRDDSHAKKGAITCTVSGGKESGRTGRGFLSFCGIF